MSESLTTDNFENQVRIGKTTAERALSSKSSSRLITYPGNELAVSVMNRLSRGETDGFSPALIVGPIGCGKSRILEHLVSETRLYRPDARITRTSGSTLRQWVSDLRKASLGRGDNGRFPYPADEESEVTEWSDLRTVLRETDLVIIDDLDLLSDQFAAVKELEHAIDSASYSGCAFVMTIRSTPSPEGQWPDRFLSQLGSGLVLPIALPDEPAKRRFVHQWSSDNGTPLPIESIEKLVAATPDFGTLKGRLERFRLMSKVEKAPIADLITAEIERSERAVNADETMPSPNEIMRVVAKFFSVKSSDIRGTDRHPGFVLPRHAAIWLCDRYCGLSRNKLGKHFSNRDAATVRHAIRRIDSLRVADLSFDTQMASLEARVVSLRKKPVI